MPFGSEGRAIMLPVRIVIAIELSNRDTASSTRRTLSLPSFATPKSRPPLGAADMYFVPQHALTWMIGMGAMAAVWLVAIVIGRASSARTDSERCFLFLSMALAGLLIAVSLGVALAGAFGFGSQRAMRSTTTAAPRLSCMFAGLTYISNGKPRITRTDSPYERGQYGEHVTSSHALQKK
jgi:hypothetical protein